MTFTEAVDRLAKLDSREEGDWLIAEYAAGAPAGTPDDFQWARRELGWLTGELEWEARDRALEFMPTVSHPLTGRRTGPISPEELFGLAYNAGGEHPLGDRAEQARAELGYGLHGSDEKCK